MDREGLVAGAAGEVADDEVVEGQRKRHDHGCPDGGHDEGQLHLEERLQRRAPQILGSFGQVFIHLPQLRQDVQDNIGQAERDVRDEQRVERQRGLQVEHPRCEHEQQHQGDTGNDVRVHHGDVGDGHHRAAQPLGTHYVDAHRRQGADDRGQHCGQHGEHQGVAEGLQRAVVAEDLPVPFQGETLHLRRGIAAVEGDEHHHDERRVQEQEDDAQIDF